MRVNPAGDLENGLEKSVDQEPDTKANGMPTVTGAELTGVDEADAVPFEGEEPPVAESETAAPDAVPVTETLLTEIVVTVREIATASERYHARAQQREGVIDHLRDELELLRRGERRGLLRPVLADLCRLRDDLLKQAAALPSDFDAAKAADLLRSYAETIELTLENNGVVAFAPDSGDPFNARMHRKVNGETATDPALAGRIAGVRRDGYLDIESNSPIAPAEVTVYATTEGKQ
jgi:molecular chaperone GrpE